MSFEPRFQPTDAIATEVVDGELVLLQLDDGVYFGLDPLGTRIWQWLMAGRSLDQITTELSALYPAQSRATLRFDVQALVNELLAAKLVLPCSDRP